jgi:peptidoglycan/xylan/chitin deacetylase (PgdA/CDA1 family)
MRARVLVLCYHAVSERWPADLSIAPRTLRRQLESLLARGWAATTFTHAVTDPPGGRVLAVTFDDGFRSVGERAAPLLAELGIPATVFVPTDWPGRVMRWPGIDRWLDTPFRDELRALPWAELRALAAAGWEIGSHSCSHPHLSRLDDDAIERELGESRAACERELRRPCRSLAYPYGDADDRVRAAAAAAGYEAAAGLSAAAFDGRSRFEWPRIGVWHGEPDWRFRVKVSPLASQLLGARSIRALHGPRVRRARHG